MLKIIGRIVFENLSGSVIIIDLLSLLQCIKFLFTLLSNILNNFSKKKQASFFEFCL